MTYWTLNGRNLTSKKVSTAKPKVKPEISERKDFMSSVHIGNEFFIGAEDGNIYQFNPNENGSHVLIDYFAASICDYDPTAASKSKLSR